MKYKIMRMICMFDLPVDTEQEKREYRNSILSFLTLNYYWLYLDKLFQSSPVLLIFSAGPDSYILWSLIPIKTS